MMIRPLLILDLDLTLLLASRIPLSRQPDSVIGPYWIYRRPGAPQFLSTVDDDYDLGVWTAGSAEYAERVVEEILLPYASLDFIWSRDRCTWRPAALDSPAHWLKDLRKVKRRGYDLRRVLFVDDNPLSLERNYGNHVQILPYAGDESDNELLHLGSYLGSIACCANFRRLEKRFWRCTQAKDSVVRTKV